MADLRAAIEKADGALRTAPDAHTWEDASSELAVALESLLAATRDAEHEIADYLGVANACEIRAEKAEAAHAGCDAQVRELVSKALRAVRGQEAAEASAERLAEALREIASACECGFPRCQSNVARAALARETERAEKAERERDADKWDRKTWHAYREKVERVFDVFANEVMPIAHVEDHRRDPEVVLPYLEAWFERLQAAESERDSLRSRLAALGNDLTLTRGAMAADDARLREAAIRVWGEHVRGCDTPDEMADLIRELRRQLAALSHLGTGAGRRAG